MVDVRKFCSLAGVASLMLALAASPLSTRANDPCDSNAMTQAIQACGMNLNCINQVNADFMTHCFGGQPPAQPQQTPPAGRGLSESELQQRIDACGMNLGCLNQVMQEIQANLPQPASPPGPPSLPAENGGEFSLPDPEDTSHRIHAQTVLPASWLQTYQNGLVACGADAACWAQEVQRGVAYPQTYCGSRLTQERTVVCLAAASNEVHIEIAIAQQRLWRQGIRVRDPAQTGTSGSAEQAVVMAPWDDVEAAHRASSFTPTVSEGRVRSILDQWRAELESHIAVEARQRVTAAADTYPLTANPELPALSYELVGETYELKPTRRDWAYALIGNLLTQAGLLEAGRDGELLRDLGLWSLVRAAQLTMEPEHLANVGFHLNLRAQLEEARDLLIYANNQAPAQADVHNNLAFSYAALGDQEQAQAAQEMAYRAAPNDPHIRSRYAAMISRPLAEQPSASTVPPGWDFGAAYFRLSKRHSLREYWANKRWSEARMQAQVSTQGGDLSGRKYLGWYQNVSEDGPWAWYEKRLKDIDQVHDDCYDGAPEVLQGCPFGAYIDHPSCRNAASPEQVACSEQNRKGHLCRCDANRIFEQAAALNAYIDDAQAVWAAYEQKWRPVLLGQMSRWASDIRATNVGYPAELFHYPVETGYTQWLDDFDEDSADFWDDRLPGKLAQWQELKSQAQNLKGCPKRLPPLPPKIKKPKPEQKTTQAYGMDLLVVKFEVRLDGSFNFEFDLGIAKGGYTYNADRDSHAVKAGSGPFELEYEQGNPPPGPGSHTQKVSATGSLNFLKFIPGAGRAAGEIMDPILSFGGKYQLNWNNRTGLDGQTIFEAKPKFGYTDGKSVSVQGYSQLRN